ncbi:Methyltransferase type 11 [Acididesulfobacillus acetoxydans]|uniref:Methyltransferase type 11 n=1 Tax=Acididesulfobacillus acetoxydans TaxID=1561005 RepID=A0A8S0WQ02_9FIRM|nr:class I SAM-dependent methyltransferase [Acididesulfobacillus acetoxydans]CAA7602294.1 Methyltransferase type 11 [Acididesulfobacillus acetoxydans]CEJ07488.1 Spermidine/spermine synthases family [Acididesulfobacillus acetoxydans]
MILNSLERFFMNQPLRTSSVEYYLKKIRFGKVGLTAGSLEQKKILEVGCGSGIWTEALLKHYDVKEVHAFDIDKKMVDLAYRRLSRYIPGKLLLSMGDVTDIDERNGSVDVAFDIAILHHVEDWQRAIREIARVLLPGGVFFFEEVNKKGLEGWFNRTFFRHPTDNRFSTEETDGR